jgi:hypothetical protein
MGLLPGYEFPKIGKFGGWKIKPLLTVISIPPLLGQIIMGAIVRNAMPDSVMKPYPASWTTWMRSCCLAILLVRGGLSVTFRGNGVIVVFLSIVP